MMLVVLTVPTERLPISMMVQLSVQVQYNFLTKITHLAYEPPRGKTNNVVSEQV